MKRPRCQGSPPHRQRIRHLQSTECIFYICSLCSTTEEQLTISSPSIAAEDEEATDSPLEMNGKVKVRSSPQLLNSPVTPVQLLSIPHLHAIATSHRSVTTPHNAQPSLPSCPPSTHFQPSSIDSLRRLRDFCLTYRLRMTRLCLPLGMMELTFDPIHPHPSLVPASVTALALCPLDTDQDKSEADSALNAAAWESHWQDRHFGRLSPL